MTDDHEKRCEERIDSWLDGTRKDMRLYMSDPEVYDEGNDEIGPFSCYGTDFSFYGDEELEQCYFEFLMSGGGPSDMIRFHADGTIEYRFHDWYDGAGRDITHEDWAQWLLDLHSPLPFKEEQRLWCERIEDFELYAGGAA